MSNEYNVNLLIKQTKLIAKDINIIKIFGI